MRARSNWKNCRWTGHICVVLLALLLLGTVPAVAFAGEGSLDGRFGAGGVASFRFGFGTLNPGSQGKGIAAQRDGKVVVAGDSLDSGGSFDVLLVRLTAGGALDQTFGSAGHVDLDLGHPETNDRNSAAKAVAIQPDGKVVVLVETVVSGNTHFVLLRLTTSGQLDPSFGGNGVARDGLAEVFGEGMALDPHGRIVVTGALPPPGGGRPELFVTRFDSRGRRDAAFGSGGIFTRSFNHLPVGASTGEAAVIDAQGRAIVTGTSVESHGNDSELRSQVLLRLQADGTLDRSFGNAGVDLTRPDDQDLTGEDVELGPNGDILTAGTRGAGAFETSNPLASRFLPGGAPDGTFGAGGVAGFRGTQDSIAGGLALGFGGRVVLLGYESGTRSSFAAQLDGKGRLDTSFGTRGVTYIQRAELSAVAVSPDRAVLLGGTLHPEVDQNRVAAARLQPPLVRVLTARLERVANRRRVLRAGGRARPLTRVRVILVRAGRAVAVRPAVAVKSARYQVSFRVHQAGRYRVVARAGRSSARSRTVLIR